MSAPDPRDEGGPDGGGPTRRGRWALAGGYVLATFLAFPQPVGDRVLDLGAALAWLAPCFLILLLRGLAPRRAAWVGFLASLAAHTALIHWIYVVTVVYGNAPVVVGLVAPALLACYCALFGGIFGGVHAWLSRRGRAGPLAAALLWTALDHLRHWEFPWGVIGYAQHANPALVSLAAWGGVYALSFVTVWGGAALALAWTRDTPAWRRRAAAAAVAVLAAHGLGWLAAPDPSPEAPTVRVAVLQGNVDQGVKWSRAWSDRTLELYVSLTREAVADGAEVVVWPETAVPGTIEGNPGLRERLARLARESRADLVVGGVGVTWDGGGRPSAFFDSAFVFAPDGEIVDRYDKIKLVPFGEYVPFRPLLGLFIGAVASGATNTDVSTGERARQVELAGSGLRAGVVICYELLFPHIVRRFAADGSELLLAITNDAWYGRTGAPHQFLAITALRSVETGLATARAANTGVSGFIDPQGRVSERTPVFERAWRSADLPRHPRPRQATFYVRHGDVFATFCWAALVALAVWTAAARRAGASGRVQDPRE